MVKHRIHNPKVGGSIPPPATKSSKISNNLQELIPKTVLDLPRFCRVKTHRHSSIRRLHSEGRLYDACELALPLRC